MGKQENQDKFMSSNTYLGPYFRCKTREGTRLLEIDTCPNPTCKLHRIPEVGRFCRSCGTPIAFGLTVPWPTLSPRSEGISAAIGEALTEVTIYDVESGAVYHLWIPNVRRPGQPERLDPARDAAGYNAEVRVDGTDIEAEKEWFSVAFSAEEAKIIDAYGADAVEARWGLIQCYD